MSLVGSLAFNLPGSGPRVGDRARRKRESIMFSISSSMSHVGLIMELIEASIHQILYTRKIYPEIMFEKRQKYSMEVSPISDDKRLFSA